MLVCFSEKWKRDKQGLVFKSGLLLEGQMGAHTLAQQNLSTGTSVLLVWDPRAFFFFFLFFFFFILSLLHQVQYRNAGGRQFTPATPSTNLTKRRLQHSPSDRNVQMTNPALAWDLAQAYMVSSEHRTYSAALTPALLQHQTEMGPPPEHLQSISCSTAHRPGLKFSPAEVKGPLSHWLHRGWLSSPHIQGLLQSCLLQWHLPGAKTKYSGSPTLHH